MPHRLAASLGRDCARRGPRPWEIAGTRACLQALQSAHHQYPALPMGSGPVQSIGRVIDIRMYSRMTSGARGVDDISHVTDSTSFANLSHVGEEQPSTSGSSSVERSASSTEAIAGVSSKISSTASGPVVVLTCDVQSVM